MISFDIAQNIQLRVVSCQQLSVASNSRSMQLMVALTKNEEFSSRLNLLLDRAKAPPKNQGRARWFHDFIKKQLKINVSYEASRKWLSGESIPYTKRIGLIARGLNTTTEYLIGEQQDGAANTEHADGVNEERGRYSDKDVEMLEKINQLSEADRSRLNGIIDVLNPKHDKKTG